MVTEVNVVVTVFVVGDGLARLVVDGGSVVVVEPGKVIVEIGVVIVQVRVVIGVVMVVHSQSSSISPDGAAAPEVTAGAAGLWPEPALG